MRSGRIVVSMLCVGILAGGCSGGGGDGGTGPGNNPPPGGQQPSNEVAVTNDQFTPSNLTVASGTTVTWRWRTCDGDGYGGQNCGSHTVTFDQATGSGVLTQGTYARTFSSPGTYPYTCLVHSGMSGRVVVQ